MIHNANTGQTTQLSEPNNLYLTHFVQIRRLFMELSENLQQQAYHVIANGTSSSITNDDIIFDDSLNRNPHIKYFDANQSKIRCSSYFDGR